jgi:hypothetical protein
VSGWEKYVEQAAETVDPAAFRSEARPWRRRKVIGQMRAALAAVGPLIAEDTRDRMVTAAGKALERDGGGEQAIREVDLFEVLDQMADEEDDL